MVELRTRKREIWGDGGNHDEKLGIKKISYTSQFTIPDTAGNNTNLGCNYTVTRCSPPNRASCTPDFSYPLLSPTSFSSSSASLFLVDNSTILAEHDVKSARSICPCPDHKLTPVTAYTEHTIHRVQYTPSIAYTEYSIHRVQHTPSTAYTEYIIHRVQHTPSTASTHDSLSSLHSHDYELTPECSFSFRRASLHDQPPSNHLSMRAQRYSHLVTVPKSWVD